MEIQAERKLIATTKTTKVNDESSPLSTGPSG